MTDANRRERAKKRIRLMNMQSVQALKDGDAAAFEHFEELIKKELGTYSRGFGAPS